MNLEELKIEQPIKEVEVPAEHMRIAMIAAMITYLFGSRGSFKSSLALPIFALRCIYGMPGSTGVIVGLSFEHLGDNTLPPFFTALSKFGFKHGEHYIIGKKPPEGWPEPYLGVYEGKYSHVVSWHNGSIFYIVSLKRKASANGISAQWGIFDEVKYMNETQLTEEIFPIFRGNEEYFKNNSCYLNKFFCTDKEADPMEIQWLLDKRKLVDHETVDIIITYQIEINELRLEYLRKDIGITKKAELKRQIDDLEEELAKLRSALIYVGEINIDDIRPIMGDKWYNDKKLNSSERVWNVSYKNEDPEAVGETFYPNYSKQVHEYSSEVDIIATKPFIFAPDYQHSVAPISVAQLTKLPWNEYVSLNYVDEVYTLSDTNATRMFPNGNGSKGSLSEAVQLFCDRYKDHRNKCVYYVYDATATGGQVDKDEHYRTVKKILRNNRWRVVMIYTGRPPLHFKKYTSTATWLKHEDKTLPPILINSLRCIKLIKSINNSKTTTVSGKTEKDKSKENTNKFPDVDQSETTHFSDTFDMINHAVLFLKKIRYLNTRRTNIAA